MVLAYGAAAHRGLGVPGEELEGVHAARQLVEWYNGHPHASQATFDLSGCETAVIVGNGNVALDCARLLTKSVDELAKHDVTDYALAALSKSAVKQVVMLGRRGVLQAASLRLALTLALALTLTPSPTLNPNSDPDPHPNSKPKPNPNPHLLQAAFTIKELRDLTKLDGVACSVEAPPDAFNAAVMPAAKTNPAPSPNPDPNPNPDSI